MSATTSQDDVLVSFKAAMKDSESLAFFPAEDLAKYNADLLSGL